jgi:hypothetical protein
VQQELPDQPRWEMLPERYVFLAMRAYRKELISRARLAECLCTTENDTAVRLLRLRGERRRAHAGGRGGAVPHQLTYAAEPAIPVAAVTARRVRG